MNCTILKVTSMSMDSSICMADPNFHHFLAPNFYPWVGKFKSREARQMFRANGGENFGLPLRWLSSFEMMVPFTNICHILSIFKTLVWHLLQVQEFSWCIIFRILLGNVVNNTPELKKFKSVYMMVQSQNVPLVFLCSPMLVIMCLNSAAER